MNNKSKLLIIPLVILTSCGNTSSLISTSTPIQEVNITSLKDGLIALGTLKNYTIAHKLNNETIYSYVFTENSIGIDSKQKEFTDVLIEDDKGIYPLKYYEGFKPGEYKMDKETYYKDLWNSPLVNTMLNKELEYVNSLDENITSLKISNKRYKIAFIETLGYTSDDYVLLDYIEVSYSDSKLDFVVKFDDNDPYLFELSSFNKTTNTTVETFINQGGGAYQLNDDLKAMKRLMLSSNFTRDIYDINLNQFTGIELFHKNYFYYETTGANFGQGCLEMNQKANANHDFDLYGCYPFVLEGNLKNGFTNVGFHPTPQYTKPNIEEMYHYPLYMNLWENMQFIEEGKVPGKVYEANGNPYHIKSMTFIKDFAINFSIDQAFPFDTCVPKALAVNLNIYDEQDHYSEIEFIYYFTNQFKDYAMRIPLRDFGVSNIPLLDQVYQEYND